MAMLSPVVQVPSTSLLWSGFIWFILNLMGHSFLKTTQLSLLISASQGNLIDDIAWNLYDGKFWVILFMQYCHASTSVIVLVDRKARRYHFRLLWIIFCFWLLSVEWDWVKLSLIIRYAVLQVDWSEMSANCIWLWDSLYYENQKMKSFAWW